MFFFGTRVVLYAAIRNTEWIDERGRIELGRRDIVCMWFVNDKERGSRGPGGPGTMTSSTGIGDGPGQQATRALRDGEVLGGGYIKAFQTIMARREPLQPHHFHRK